MDKRFKNCFRIPLGVLYVLPCLIFLLATSLYPFGRALSMSFFEEVGGVGVFRGLYYYGEVLKRDDFWLITRNTFFFTGFSVLFHLLIGLGFALLLNTKNLKRRDLWRGLQFLPWLFPPVVVACTWKLMYYPQSGFINEVLRRIGLSSLTRIWLGEPSLALACITVANVWAWYPFFTIILLAGLQGIPEAVNEAATVDGVGVWSRFRHITLPYLTPVIVTGMLLDTIWTFRFFDLVWMMTKGGPINSTEILPTAVFKIAFRTFDFSRAAATGGFMVLFMSVFVVLYMIYHRSQAL